MFIALIILILLVAILMAVAVLLQSGKGGGLSGIASGGQTTQILGARQAPDFLEKATWTLGATFLILCVLTTFVIPGGAAGSILQERAGELPAGAAPSTLPIESGAPASTPQGATGEGASGAPATQAPPAATPGPQTGDAPATGSPAE